jgi:predicted nucleic acid-binding protein
MICGSADEYAADFERLGLQNERELRELLSLLAHGFHVLFSARTPKVHVVEEDPDDDKFIECAVALKADFVISGDRALIAVQDYMGIRIVTPREFIDSCM